MSTQSSVLVRSFFVSFLVLCAVAGCVPALPDCPTGFVLEGGRCVQELAPDSGVPLGDAGPTPMIDAGSDAGSDAAMQDGGAPMPIDAGTELPDAYVEPPDAFVALPDAYVAPDACAFGVWYADADGDGFGNHAMPIDGCMQPPGTVSDATDCDDTRAAVHPGATEICNGLDDDCDGITDVGTYPTFYLDADGDGHGDATRTATTYCTAPPSYVTVGDDCDDRDARRFPGNTEVCNGIDDDCSGTVDEGLLHTYYADCDGDGFASSSGQTLTACPTPAAPTCTGLGTVRRWTETAPAATTTDCDDANAAFRPDNRYWPDCDGDGFAAPSAAVTVACVRPPVAPSSCGASLGATWTATAPVAGVSDCGDLSRFAYPHSTYVSTASFVANDGTTHSWDYDCDGTQTPTYPNGNANATGWCHHDIATGACVPTTQAWQALVPACGASGTLWTCTSSGGSCVGGPSGAATQSCH